MKCCVDEKEIGENYYLVGGGEIPVCSWECAQYYLVTRVRYTRDNLGQYLKKYKNNVRVELGNKEGQLLLKKDELDGLSLDGLDL